MSKSSIKYNARDGLLTIKNIKKNVLLNLTIKIRAKIQAYKHFEPLQPFPPYS